MCTRSCRLSGAQRALPLSFVGLGIGLLQALTQIQEMTLVFVPKIIAIFVVLLISLPFAGQAMYGLMLEIANRIAAY